MTAYDGHSAEQLASALDLPQVAVFEETTSTMDRAHELASSGAVAGTLIVANHQTTGRGRHGRVWSSERDESVILSLVERPADVLAIRVLSLRLGLLLAEALDEWCESSIQLKWPNDLYVGRAKLAGILVESRWTASRGVDWIVVGVGLNLQVPEDRPGTAALRGGLSQFEVLQRVVPAIREASSSEGLLSDAELRRWATRDLAIGRRAVAPKLGIVRGLDASGALRIEQPGGIALCTAGSLVFTED